MSSTERRAHPGPHTLALSHFTDLLVSVWFTLIAGGRDVCWGIHPRRAFLARKIVHHLIPRLESNTEAEGGDTGCALRC